MMGIINKWTLSLKKRSKDFLFDGDDRLFKTAAGNAQVYAEYGVGKSSIWVLQNTSAHILAVDTSEHWINHVKAGTTAAERFEVNWIDLGAIGWAGRPQGYQARDKFQRYIESVWTRATQPDLILVDGRFRVACFLFSLASAKPGSTILFDDYVNRPHYHLVEEYLTPSAYCGRQAQFIVPEGIIKQAFLQISLL